MQLKIAICDDEESIVRELDTCISTEFAEANLEVSISCYTNAEDFLKDYYIKQFDIIFLAIDIPIMNGVEVAKRLRLDNSCISIIFVTNREDLVFECIKFNPFRFIRKCNKEVEIKEAIEALIIKIRSENQFYTIKFNNQSESIRISDIIYVESNKHDIYINTIHSNYRIKSNLKTLEKEFEVHGFIRVHSGYLVNQRFIHGISKSKITLANKEEIPVSRYRLEYTREKLLWYSREM